MVEYSAVLFSQGTMVLHLQDSSCNFLPNEPSIFLTRIKSAPDFSSHQNLQHERPNCLGRPARDDVWSRYRPELCTLAIENLEDEYPHGGGNSVVLRLLIDLQRCPSYFCSFVHDFIHHSASRSRKHSQRLHDQGILAPWHFHKQNLLKLKS